MWHRMFAEQIPFDEKLLRTVVVYGVVAVLIRLTGKRSLAGLNTLDIAVVFLLSNVVQNAIIGDDLSVTGGAIGAVTLVAVNSLLNRLALTSSLFARIFDGTETRVIANGVVLERPTRRLGLRPAELAHAVRIQNGEGIAQVESAVLEPSGQLLVTLQDSEQSATKADVAQLKEQLARIESALAAQRG
jgi:uncharacterized membrane protein YcaP (DUF421 family)